VLDVIAPLEKPTVPTAWQVPYKAQLHHWWKRISL